jgi:2-(1,2-epoxy-1,2-dihydrophenyl)acetyl-CoA isomerase
MRPAAGPTETIGFSFMELTNASAAVKRLLWGGVGATVADRLNEEARTVSELSGTADSLEGLAAVIEKRSPRFEGR